MLILGLGVDLHILYTGGGSGDDLCRGGQDTSHGRGGGCVVDGAVFGVDASKG